MRPVVLVIAACLAAPDDCQRRGQEEGMNRCAGEDHAGKSAISLCGNQRIMEIEEDSDEAV
eukprot:scaffold733_cov267-Pinguiococcus_pyrenoidosus.AAC.59